MNTKTKNKSTPESIKSELNTILEINTKRKSAIEKITKKIIEEKSKSNINYISK